MDTKFAKISNRADPPSKTENAQAVMKGGRIVCSLVEEINVPKSDDGKLASKTNKIIADSYLKRPSLRNEAMEMVYKFANNGILVKQNPNCNCSASASTVFILKNKYVYACAGQNVIYHFIDGKLSEVFEATDDNCVCLGNLRYNRPLTSEQKKFTKNDHTFLICTRKFADEFSKELLEDTLSKSTCTKSIRNHTMKEVNCDRWLEMLKDCTDGFDSEDNYSAIAMHIPNKRKKPKWMLAVIAIVLALIIAFFGFGAIERNKNRPEGAPNASQQDGVQRENAPPRRPPLFGN